RRGDCVPSPSPAFGSEAGWSLIVQFSFRQRVLLLAVALVMAIQLVTLFPVLSAVKSDVDEQAQHSVDIAGTVFEEFMRNRADQLLTTVNVLVSDYGFKQAWSSGDHATIRSALMNHARRVGAAVALLSDLEGNVVVRA